MNLRDLSAGEIVFIVFVTSLLIQLWYYLGFFSRLAFYKKRNPESSLPPVSVVICARNEDDNLAAFLPLIMAQDYPEFEVVVVNDCSFDHTGDVLEEFARKYSRLKIVTIKEDENFSHGKKFAQMVGIKGARYEHLLFTDADCKPVGTQWIRQMASAYGENTEIVLGYGAYEKNKSFLNKLIRFDTFIIGLQYLSFCLAGRTYMGIGRNLSYKKSLFFKLKGFASHYHIESGDDDLLVNEAATKLNSRVSINPESFTVSVVKKTFKAWKRQKRRHITTAGHYNVKTKIRLALLTGSQYLFFTSLIFCLVFKFNFYAVLAVFCFRLCVQFIIFIKTMKKLQERDLLFLFPLLEILLMIFYPALLLSNTFLKKHKWRS